MTTGAVERSGRPEDRRELVIDVFRVVSLGVVVAYHWLGLLPQLHSGTYTDRPVTVAVPHLWPLTWLINVLPLFLFVGGYANARSYESSRCRGDTDWQWLKHRYRRLLVPTLIFIVACSALLLVVGWFTGLFGSTLSLLSVRNTAPFGQLWFVGVYMIQIALVPLTLRAHRRYGLRALAAIVIATAFTDMAAWGLGTTAPLLLNVALVWMVPHQLGYFYAEERIQQLNARTWVAIACIALLSLALVTSFPYYNRDLIDPTLRVLTFQAFTFPLVLQAMWIIALAMLCRPFFARLLQRSAGMRYRVTRSNDSIMTVFLWHTAALMLTVLALSGVPGVLSSDPTLSWWATRPLVVIGAMLGVTASMIVISGLQRVAARQRIIERADSDLNTPGG